MRRPSIRLAAVLVCITCAVLPVFIGCSDDSKSTGPNPDTGGPVDYFSLSVGDHALFCVFTAAGESLGVASYRVINTFAAESFSGYVTVDSTLESVDTLWTFESADTVFQMWPGSAYNQRQPVVRNFSKTEFSWPLYVVGEAGSPNRYTVVFYQRPETETIVTTRGQIFTNCARTDLVAEYEQSGQTVSLGSAYYAPNVGLILTSFRPFVQSEVLFREIMQ